MKKIFSILILLIIFSSLIIANDNSPKREFRAAWISTVLNIDWPSSPGLPVETLKEELITILDYLKESNLNAVVFQVRPACDAMYASTIEPWSSWLTGQQGRAPGGDFDPLTFAVEEAHKRGMELHAWFNPYRVSKQYWNLILDENHVAKKHPDWVIDVNGDKILNPGLPQVRNYVTSVIMDVVNRYDVDAIHFDDYFYLEGISDQDAKTFEDYSNGFTNLGDWRRNNVNELIRMVYNTIQATRPNVKFGQSPPGIWKTGVPYGIFGRSTYSAIYCDAPTWLAEGIVDYLAPQLYWKIGGSQDYSKLMPWWIEQRNDRHIYPGLAFYRATDGSFGNDQLGPMVKMNRETEGCEGQIFFTAHNFKDNLGGNTDTLQEKYFQYKSIIPIMSHREQEAPSAPTNLRYDKVIGTGTTGITWDKSQSDDSKFYVLYRFENSSYTSIDLSDPKNIYDITSNNYFNVNENFPVGNAYYVVTALDENHNESIESNLFEFNPQITIPSVPELIEPIASESKIRDTLDFVWRYSQNANSYTLEISEKYDFSTLSKNIKNIIDTSFTVTGIKGETEYFWRIKAENSAGSSDYSEVRDFKTAFPSSPDLTNPADLSLDNSLTPLYTWQDRNDAISYQLQVFNGSSVNADNMIIDTILNVNEYDQKFELNPSTIYCYRVRTKNEYGTSLYSDINKFKTLSILPEVPVLISPVDLFDKANRDVKLVWNKSSYANSYEILVANDYNFNDIFKSVSVVNDTSVSVDELSGDSKYYWKAAAVNNSGKSDYSEIRSFETGFPKTPNLVYPLDKNLDTPVKANLLWTSSASADKYQVQIATDNTFEDDRIIIDTLVTDTSYTTAPLSYNFIYSWRVKGISSISSSDWSDIYRFKTVVDENTSIVENTMPIEYKLYQNYPNPFNPSTVIKFDLSETSFTKLEVYNILGEKIKTLVSEKLSAGSYKYEFTSETKSGTLSSGIYFYVLKTDKYTDIKKMILVK